MKNQTSICTKHSSSKINCLQKGSMLKFTLIGRNTLTLCHESLLSIRKTILQCKNSQVVNKVQRSPHIRFLHSSLISDSKDPEILHATNQDSIQKVINDTFQQLPLHPTAQRLEQIAEELTLADAGFRKMVNYKMLIDSLEETGYFTHATIWHTYITYYRPFIKAAKKEHYNMRVSKFLEVLQFIADKELNGALKEGELESLKRILYPDLVDTIKFAISTNDVELIDDLLDVVRLQYDSLHPDDWHTFLFAALESSNADTLRRLLFGDLGYDKPSFSRAEDNLAQALLASSGYAQELARLWKPDSSLNSYKASLLVQSFSNLNIKDTIELLSYISPILEGPLSTKDFQFIAETIVEDLESNSIKRKKFKERGPASLRRHAKLNIQRIDIHDTLHTYEVFQSKVINDQTKSLFANLFLKALSSITNNTGVIYAYTEIPKNLLNQESFEILFHACAKGNDNQLRAIELLRFATENLKLRLSASSFEFLLETCKHNPNSSSIIHCLNKYFGAHSELTPKMKYLLTPQISSKSGIVTKQITNTEYFLFKLSDTPDPVNFIKELYLNSNDQLELDLSKIHSSKFDESESKMLQRHHSETFIP